MICYVMEERDTQKIDSYIKISIFRSKYSRDKCIFCTSWYYSDRNNTI